MEGMKKKPTTEVEFDLAEVREIKRLLNRTLKRLETFEKSLRKRARLEPREVDAVVSRRSQRDGRSVSERAAELLGPAPKRSPYVVAPEFRLPEFP